MPSIFKLHSKFKTCGILGWNYALLHSHSLYTQYHLEHYQYSYFHYQLYKFWLSETLELTSHCPKFVQNASFITFRTSFKLSKMQAFHPLELTQLSQYTSFITSWTYPEKSKTYNTYMYKRSSSAGLVFTKTMDNKETSFVTGLLKSIH